MADTVSVTQALLMARSWLPHANDCAAVNPKPTGDGYNAACTCGLTEKLQVIDSALASTQPAPAFPREEVAKLVAPDAWEQRERHLHKAASAGRRSEALDWLRRADDVVAASLRTADAIAALLQGKQP